MARCPRRLASVAAHATNESRRRLAVGSRSFAGTAAAAERDRAPAETSEVGILGTPLPMHRAYRALGTRCIMLEYEIRANIGGILDHCRTMHGRG